MKSSFELKKKKQLEFRVLSSTHANPNSVLILPFMVCLLLHVQLVEITLDSKMPKYHHFHAVSELYHGQVSWPSVLEVLWDDPHAKPLHCLLNCCSSENWVIRNDSNWHFLKFSNSSFDSTFDCDWDMLISGVRSCLTTLIVCVPVSWCAWCCRSCGARRDRKISLIF